VLVFVEMLFSCPQDQGDGKLPTSGAEAKGNSDYLVALTMAGQVSRPTTLYYYCQNWSAENLGRILEDYDFGTLATDNQGNHRTIQIVEIRINRFQNRLVTYLA